MIPDERVAFEAVLDQVYKLPDHIKDDLWQHAIIDKYSKKTHILEQNQIERHITFLHQGLIRAYQLQEDKEVSLDFRFSGDIMTAYTSYISQRPSPVAIQALEDCIILKIPKTSVEALFDKYHEFERLGRLMTEHFYLRRVQREIEILSHSAEERYQHLLKREPNLVAKIPVKHLASYLGIHKQSLSRIRSKVRI
ncbi:hypothetical protein BKI52_16520 [marine bacterium AO1-C]|nr:hypothetical protein BKI52_16520 [marine bacterium AO1-C]